MKRDGTLRGQGKHYLRSTLLAGLDDLARSPFRTHGSHRQGIANTEPGKLCPMLPFEECIAWAAGAHEAWTDGRDHHALRSQLSPQPLRQADQCELAGPIGEQMGNTDFATDGGDVDNAP